MEWNIWQVNLILRNNPDVQSFFFFEIAKGLSMSFGDFSLAHTRVSFEQPKDDKKRTVQGCLGTYFIQSIQHFYRPCPVDARIRDTDSMFEPRGSLAWHILPTLVDVRLDHNTGDIPFTCGELRAHITQDRRLIIMVFLRISIWMKRVSSLGLGSGKGSGHWKSTHDYNPP